MSSGCWRSEETYGLMITDVCEARDGFCVDTFDEMINDFKNHIKSFLNSHLIEKFLTLFNSIPVMILIFDEDGILSETNDPLIRSIGFQQTIRSLDLFGHDLEFTEKVLEIHTDYLSGKFLVFHNQCKLEGNGTFDIFVLIDLKRIFQVQGLIEK